MCPNLLSVPSQKLTQLLSNSMQLNIPSEKAQNPNAWFAPHEMVVT
jgi:hypothetical protein